MSTRYARSFLAVVCFPAASLLLAASSERSGTHPAVHVSHKYANTNAVSLIGLPMGSRKTLVDTKGNLRWSQWELRRRPADVPFGFSSQLDGALHIEVLASNAGGAFRPLPATGQELHRGRFPFVTTRFDDAKLHVEELAFAVETHGIGLDAVRLQFENRGANEVKVEVRISGRRANLPGHVRGATLATRDGFLVVLGRADNGVFESAAEGLALTYDLTAKSRSSSSLWLELPYDFPSGRLDDLERVSVSGLLETAEQSWEHFWKSGMTIELPEKELEDFYYSSLAYVVILTERDAAGDLWALDGPSGYRQFWGRGEYFQARALEVGGHVEIARETVEHTFRLQMDDGEWAGPPISGYPAWDNIGGNAAAVWDYYRFTGGRAWLEKAYPYLLSAARWIRFHREETQLPPSAVPPGAVPIRRQLPWSCRPEPDPPLSPGEKPYWWGLLPWGYGDSGLPEGHGFPHNVMALYAVRCAQLAASELGKSEDADWLSREYTDFKGAIMTAINRSIQLEKEGPPYLPAMPTYPDAAVSQSLLAVHPTELYPPDHALVTGLLERMGRTELQGLPSNMAWMGYGGVWPGASINVAETYLRRGDVDKTVRLLLAALEHSYATKVWREEISVDPSRPRACTDAAAVSRQHKKGEGSGDMPEAWANANLVNLLRDMLLYEKSGALRLLMGVPADWIGEGEQIVVEKAPTLLGATVSFRLRCPSTNRMTMELELPARPVDVIVRFPIGSGRKIDVARINGQSVQPASDSSVELTGGKGSVRIEIEHRRLKP